MESDFSVLKWEKDIQRSNITPISLEVVLHCRQIRPKTWKFRSKFGQKLSSSVYSVLWFENYPYFFEIHNMRNSHYIENSRALYIGMLSCGYVVHSRKRSQISRTLYVGRISFNPYLSTVAVFKNCRTNTPKNLKRSILNLLNQTLPSANFCESRTCSPYKSYLCTFII